MPHIDGRSGEIVIRIVYDGAPEAGKTTNVLELATLISLQRRGAARSFANDDGRTEFFDWLDFSGGYLDGRRVRCQLVSVPGQSDLLHRRRYLLESADAIVFVTDSRPEAFDAAAANLRATLRIAENQTHIPVGIILQANKQDLPRALPPDEVARQLGLEGAGAVVGAVASTGEGIMQTFIVAVRVATDRVRALLLREDLGAFQLADISPDSLHAAMLDVSADNRPAPPVDGEEVPAAASNAVHPDEIATESAPVDSPAPVGVGALLEEDSAASNGAEAEAEAPKSRPEPETPLFLNPALAPPFDATRIGRGRAWPPVRGRAAMTSFGIDGIRVPTHTRAWAPLGALELRDASDWTLHSMRPWCFHTELEAEIRFRALVARFRERCDVMPQGRYVAIVEDGGRLRVWVATPPVVSLADELSDALTQHQPSLLARLVDRTVAALLEVRPDVRPNCDDLSSVALQDDRWVELSLPVESAGASSATKEPFSAMLLLLFARLSSEGWLQDWYERFGRELLERSMMVVEAEGACEMRRADTRPAPT